MPNTLSSSHRREPLGLERYRELLHKPYLFSRFERLAIARSLTGAHPTEADYARHLASGGAILLGPATVTGGAS